MDNFRSRFCNPKSGAFLVVEKGHTEGKLAKFHDQLEQRMKMKRYTISHAQFLALACAGFARSTKIFFSPSFISSLPKHDMLMLNPDSLPFPWYKTIPQKLKNQMWEPTDYPDP